MGLRNRAILKHKRCFFVTTTCNRWQHIFTNANRCGVIINSLDFVANKYEAKLLAFVIMREAAPPNHLHFIIVFGGENLLSNLMRDFKKFTSGEVRRILQQENEDELLNKLTYEHRTQKFKIWMDGFDDVWLGKREIVETKIKYIHNNPLQPHWGLAESPTDYEYSSAKFYYSDQKRLLNLTHYREYF